MSRIFNLIEHQIGMLIKTVAEDETSSKDAWFPGAQYIKPISHVVAIIIFLLIILQFGVYLWNQGLHPAFPQMIAKIDGTAPNQLPSPFMQLATTLFALIVMF